MSPSRRAVTLFLTLLGLSCLPLSAQSRGLVKARDAEDDRVSRAATSLRISVDDLKRLARRDGDLHVSATGNLFYACRRQPGRAGARVVVADNSAFTANAPYALDQTFRLHSRPGSTKVLYLDFDGHTITGTRWNEDPDIGSPVIVIPPFSTDNNPAAFSNAERTIIQQVWRRVAEDFAPFDVDVTTEEPTADALLRSDDADTSYGVRALVGGDAEDLSPQLGGMGILGIAQFGAFGADVDTPVLNFSEAHGTDWAMLADTVSHETGHALNLFHHGSDQDGEYYRGHGNWAPIMGSGPSTSVSQWSRGDYAGATNPTQDDLAVISELIPLAPIDHPVNALEALVLSRGDLAAGTILNAGDTAWYQIEAGGGKLTLSGTPSFLGPNLKVGLTLLDGNGQVVASSSQTTASMSASLTYTVPTAGTYYAVVDGIGYRTVNTGFTDYASVGRFSLTGSWALNQAPIASTAGSTPLLGGFPLTVAFNGSSSFDFDGAVESYSWEFGDGASSTLANPTHVYTAPGNYTAVLTVRDALGATSSSSVVVTVAPRPIANRPMRVLAMTPSWVALSRTSGAAQCLVRVVDSAGRPLPGVTLTASVQGLDSATVTVVTDRMGNATLRSAALPTTLRGTVTFTVRNVTLPGYTYLPALNKVNVSTVRR